jgi:hypothetical protein
MKEPGYARLFHLAFLDQAAEDAKQPRAIRVQQAG